MTDLDPDATPPQGVPVFVAAPSPGHLIAGRYEVRRPLSSGGEADVLVAHDLDLDLDVVVKVHRFRSDTELSELRHEAGLLMRVGAHPSLPVVRSDAVDGDAYCMIVDHVDGRDLREVTSAQTGDGLPLPTVLDLIETLASALDHLHAQQPPVVHGDLKPENVIVTQQGRPVLVDFGASIRVGDDRSRLGTVGFSAPEVLAGEPVGPTSDIFSLAALTIFLLTDITPRPGAPWPAAMAGGRLARLERVLRRGLTWDPAGRPWKASAFAAELRAAAEDELPTGTVTALLVTSGGAVDSLPAAIDARLDGSTGQRVDSISLPPGTALTLFARASEAAQTALDLADEAAAMHASCRIALHAGDLGGSLGGTVQQLTDEALALAARRDDAAVVCSHSVRMLLGAVPSLEFDRVRPDGAELRAAAPAESAARHDGRAAAAPNLVGDLADTWIATRRAAAMAGRDDDVAQALLSVDQQRAAASAAMLVVQGEAGMGKTRFLAELASRARSAGELVLVGRCTQSGGAFEPFLDALGDDAFPFEQGRLERDEEGWVDRRRFFGRIAEALASQGRAVTLVIDDAQWIDGSSLALLSQLLDDVGPQLAVLTGARPSADPALLDELLVRPGSTQIVMRHITLDDFVTMAADRGVGAERDELGELHALTAGSPFFASQLLDHLRHAPSDTDQRQTPDGIRNWIRGRAERLGDEAFAVLATAATIGRRFDVMVLADVSGSSPLHVVDHLELALDAGLINETDRAGEFGFVHDIVRAELADSSSSTRRGLLHAAIARRLEEDGDDIDRLDAALHHWLAADRLGDPIHTGEVAARVGTLATERLAHERAIDVLRRGLTVLAGAAAGVDRSRAEAQVRVALGRALFIAAASDEALEELRAAADLAERAGDGETLAHAALVASLNRRHGRDDPELLELLERASERSEPEPAVLPAMLHIRRSRLLPLDVPHHERSALARRGLENLHLMDPADRATVETEVARACWNPDDAGDRIDVTTRVIDTAERARDAGGPSRWTGVTIEALNVRWASHVQLGRLRDGLADATAAVALADDAGSTFLLSRSLMGEAMIRAALGEHDVAEARSARALEISDRHNLRLDSMAIAYCIGRDRGAQAELAALESALGDLVDTNPLFVAAFALVHAEAGNVDDARRLLDDLDRRQPWVRNWVWASTIISALEAAVLVGDTERTRRLRDLLAPLSGQWAVAAAELGCWGPVDRVLGVAAAHLGDDEHARQLLISARDSSSANGATHWLARCHAGLASLASPPEDSST